MPEKQNLYAAIAVTSLAFTGASCEAKHGPVMPPGAEAAESRPGRGGVSLIRMNDPKASGQLLSGFYGIEANSWRWTAGKFSARLHAPPSAATAGATLTLELTVPDVALQKTGDVTLTASVNGMELQSSKYDHAGAFAFTAEVPPSMFTAGSVKVDFSLDKTFHAGADTRDLGVVAVSLRLAAK
jgi:hypothetical protein